MPEKGKEMMKINDFSWKIAGAAGDGILSAGMLFAKTCVRAGLDVMATAEYPSLIRGGHNHLDVRVGGERVSSHTSRIDLLVALNQDSIDYHAGKVAENGAIIYDGDEADIANVRRQDIHFFDIPLKKIANENGGTIMRNTIAMGATIGLLDFDLELFNKVIGERFGKKSAEIIEANTKAARAGYDYARKNFSGKFMCKLEKQAYRGHLMLTGNEAISAGAIKAGCKFFAAYPMTPASSLLHFMAANEKDYGIVVKHTEDEIAAINMAIGAGYAGARAMTGTSGGGFALMVEAFGLAAMTETPLVVVEAQRPGPATGMATHSSQGDLRYMLHSGTDEFPRIVVAPGNVDECFYETIRAFNLAEKYQTPVIILTDKYLGESYWSTEEFETNNIKIERGLMLTDKDLEGESDYRRYKITPSGVSPRSRPGVKNGMFVASSYEHDEKGLEREEEPVRVAMHKKRFRKLDFIKQDTPLPQLKGEKDAEITILAWGSTKGPIEDAMKILEKEGIKTNFLQILYPAPFASEHVKKILSESKTIVCIENNKTGQLADVLREKTGIDVQHRILKFDGRPFSPEDISQALRKISEKNAEKNIVISDVPETIDLDSIKMRTFKVTK